MQDRHSRMDKYYDALDEELDTNTGEIRVVSSRLQKNQELYKEVGSLDIDDFDLNSNVSILGDNTANIDLNDIQEKLHLRYHEEKQDKGLGVGDEDPLPKINLDETREYDINNILAKAKEDKEIDYEEERLKKLRNTQYDILKNLDIEGKEEEVSEKKVLSKKSVSKEEEEKKLLDLIDTITAKELIKNEENLEVEGEMDPLDILSDLKGDDENTRVMGAIALDEENELEENTLTVGDLEDLEEAQEELENTKTLEETKELEDTQETEEDELDDTQEVEPTQEIPSKKKPLPIEDTDTNLITKDNSFIGDTSKFTQDDFDDFKDLKDDMKFSKIFVRVFIAILVIVFIVGIVILLNNYLELGLF